MVIDWKKQLDIKVTTLSEATKIIGDSDDYYVYIIWKMYTESPVPFYVGKGHLQRLVKHEMKSEENNNVYKTKIIRKHKRLGIKCGYSICNFFKNENDALSKEVDLIKLIGRHDLESGPLANKTDGGDGSSGHLALRGGDSLSAKPVFANNKLYSCLKDASEELKVTAGAITQRIKNGWLGYYYKDEGQRPQTKKLLFRYRKEVVVEGQKFISASEAARKLNLDVRMISKRIGYGWEGYYYLDKGQLPKKTVWGSREDKVAVKIRGINYLTTTEAVRKTGESEAKIRKRSLSSNYPNYIRLDGKVEQKQSPPKIPLKVVIKKICFESSGEAAKVYKMTSGGVKARCASSNYPEWCFLDAEVQKKKEVKSEFSSNPIKVQINGVSYESQSSAARAYNIDINTAKKRFRSFSFPDWICSSAPKQKPKDGKMGMIGVKINDKIFRSVNAASSDTDESRSVIKQKALSEQYNNYELVSGV